MARSGRAAAAGRPRATRDAAQGAQREQQASAFAVILGALVRRTPGAIAAALVDFEGETVDYAGRMDTFALKVAAAHWRILLEEARAQPALGSTEWVACRASGASFVVRGLPQGYAVVVAFVRSAGLAAASRRSFDHCAIDLGREAGWIHGGASWFAVDVITERRRPTAFRRGAEVDPIDVIGVQTRGLGRREQGWRVRTASGVETTLVREPGGLWYADDQAAVSPERCDLPGLRATGRISNKRF